MFRIAQPLAFMFQVQGGNGAGRYIDDLANQNAYDSFFQYPTNAQGLTTSSSHFVALKAINFIAGFTINWTNNLETNLGGSYTNVQKPGSGIAFFPIPAAANAAANTALPTSRMQRYHVNLIYTIVPKTFILFEVEQYYRQAGWRPGTKYKGKDTRFVFSFIRNF